MSESIDSQKKVSVIIPSYKRNEYLQRCIKSVLDQSYTNVEIIVVDDSGSNYAEDVIKKFKGITYISHSTNRGPNAARKTGIKEANGEYIQLLDDDDILKSKKIATQVSKLENNPQAGVAYCGYKKENGVVKTQKEHKNGDVMEQVLKFDLTCITSSMLLRRDIAELILDLPNFPGADDTFWKIEFAQKTEFVYVDDVLLIKGMPGEQRMYTKGAIEGSWLVLDRYADLYSSHRSEIYQTALSKAMSREAKYRLSKQCWSSRAIVLSFYSFYHAPDPTKYQIVLPFFSIFGTFGYMALQKLVDIKMKAEGVKE